MHWRTRSFASLLVVVCLIFASFLLRAQTSADAATFAGPQLPRRQPTPVSLPTPVHPTPPGHSPPPPAPITFPKIVQAAGTIFQGTVTKIEPGTAPGGAAIATVAITFHVERTFRGTTPGEDFTIQQWLGLWSGGQRYMVGEHVLLFLYPPSKLGLTSAVAGSIGRFHIEPPGRILLNERQLALFREDPLLAGQARLSFNDFAVAMERAQRAQREAAPQ